MVVACTGHRPQKLFGYEKNHPGYIWLKERMKYYLVYRKADEGISGMALGADLIFCEAIMELKSQGYPIKLHCAIPCLNHKAKWNNNSEWIKIYDAATNIAETVKIVTELPYNQFVMDIRNHYMVDRCDNIMAIYDGSGGGTENCIRYAKEKGKHIDILNPNQFKK